MSISPGVKVTESSKMVSNATSGPRVMAVLGLASSTYVVANLDCVCGSGSTDTITGTQSSDVVSVIGVGSLPGLYDFVLGTDFTVTNNTIIWIGTHKPSAGSTYYVSYNQNKGSSFYQPSVFTDPSTVESIYGPALSNGVISEVTLGSQIAFENGASEVVCLQVSNNLLATQKAAIDLLETQDIDFLLYPGVGACNITLQQYAMAHCLRMSTDTEKMERIYITNPSSGSVVSSDIINSAIAFNNDVVTMIAPPSMNVVLTDAICNIDLTVSVPSAFAGCAIAGISTAYGADEATPLTRAQLLGIDSLNGSWKNSVMDQMDANGVLILVNNNGVIQVRHAVTTAVGNINQEELEIKILRNQTRKDLRALFDPFIGQKYDNKLNGKLASTLVNFCNQKVTNKIYESYDPSSISVVQSASDPRKALISYTFTPVYTDTEIDITFAIQL